MKSNISRVLMTLGLGIALGAGPLMAQGNISADIPFAFAAGAKWLPAGHYKLSTNTTNGLVRISSADDSANLMILSTPARGRNTTGDCRLVFNKYGDRYFLSQIWRPDDLVRELPKSKAEREEMANASPSRVTLVAAK